MSYLLRTTLPDNLAAWLKSLAKQENRSKSNMNEVLIREAKAMRETEERQIKK